VLTDQPHRQGARLRHPGVPPAGGRRSDSSAPGDPETDPGMSPGSPLLTSMNAHLTACTGKVPLVCSLEARRTAFSIALVISWRICGGDRPWSL